jgi:6-phosphogluconolactonase
MTDVELPGQVRIVDDVPRAFARLVAELTPSSIALSGGELAHRCYGALRRETINWSVVDVYFGDDRVVPIESDESNEGMARRILLDEAGPRAVHSMVAAGADEYDALIRRVPPIDIVHLGLGPDGHTASLFPGAPTLDERDRFVVDAGDDEHPHPRLTFTFPALAKSVLAVVTVEGEEKREPIRRIRAGEDLPGARIRAGQVLWLGDRAALAAD